MKIRTANQIVQEVDVDETIESLNPSHILQDGRYIYLPPPTDKERTQFFERSIARYGLLQDDLGETKKKSIKEEEEKVEKREKEEPKVHPLALASARLQADGINELNRAINLSGLVSTGEYFSMTNIVDPSLELPSAAAAETAKSSAEAATSDSKAAAAAGAGATSAKSESAMEVQEEQRVKASYVLKRKRLQFQKASTVLQRNQRRLEAAIVAQARPDTRLRQLRPCWRLCAPEHGSRALPHATRPTEAVACDVDVYLKGSGEVLGRLASHVPRYATIELKEDYTVQDDLAKWKEQFFPENDPMDVDEAEGESKDESKQNGHTWTTAEPFAIADPTVGKLDADFDPKKVAMLSLWFDIEKPSTGFRQSASLEPISALAASQEYSGYQQDEKTLVALQHSLFCAKLFESIRRELAPDTEDIVSLLNSSNTQSVVWLSGESETNFLPPPSQMSGDRMCGLPPLCVVHCHEGEVKVQLDCEYTLRVRLVEAEDPTANQRDDGMDVDSPVIQSAGSGSQSPEQLSILCRALLLHAQERYHKHSIRAAERLRKMAEEEEKRNLILTCARRNRYHLPESCRVVSVSGPNFCSSIVFAKRSRRSAIGSYPVQTSI